MRNKLANKTGAALVLALLFFLLCACVGTMVVTAASANVGKTAQMREEEQRYQAVKAAANAMAQLMEESPYTAVYTEYYKKETIKYDAPNGATGTRVEETTAAIKASILNSSFPSGSKMTGLLENSVRNIYLKNTKLSNSKELLKNVSESGGGLVGAWEDTEVTDLGPDKYEWKIKAVGLPDVLLTLQINKGSSDSADNLYEATITATDEHNNHVVVLCAPASIAMEKTKVIDQGTGNVGDPRIVETKHETKISWVDWTVKWVDGGTA